MTPKEFADKMRELLGDVEGSERDMMESHKDADNLMCDVLTALGYGEGVEIFKAAHKWYA